MEKKLPKEWASMLADLHNKVMEIKDTFDTFKSDVACGVDEDTRQEMLDKEGIDLASDELWDTLSEICDKLEDVEADTSELDCEYNDYGY